MDRAAFEKLIAEEFPKAVPERFRAMVKNVAFLVEEAPSREIRREEYLKPHETLLGLYRGVPRARRGDHYGIGPTVPDVIVLYRLPMHDEAGLRMKERPAETFDEALRTVVHETIWHEVAHYLGLGEQEVRAREKERAPSGVAGKPRVLEENSLSLLPRPTAAISPSVEGEKPWRSGMEPIEVGKEDPSVARMLHETLIPGNLSSVDPEGRDRMPWGFKGKIQPEAPPSAENKTKKAEPPANLPTFEE